MAVPFSHTIYTSQILRLSIALLFLLADGVLCFNSCLGSNDYWYEVQTTIGLPANDYWFASPPYIATQLPAALFTLHSPAKCTSSPPNSLLLLPEKPPSPPRE